VVFESASFIVKLYFSKKLRVSCSSSSFIFSGLFCLNRLSFRYGKLSITFTTFSGNSVILFEELANAPEKTCSNHFS